MSTAIRSSFVDHTGLDGTGDAINGNEVDENPNVVADILDGTLATDLAGAGTLDFVMTDTRAGIRLIDLSNAAAAIHEGLVLEWDPGDGGNLTDNSSGIGIDFKLPDDADAQTVFGSLNVVCVDDAAASTDGEFSFRVTAAGTDNVEQMTLSAAALTVTPPATITGLITATAGITSGANIVSDTDSTDDLGTSSVRWANVYTDSIGDTGQDLTIAATTTNLPSGHVTDYAGADVVLTHSAGVLNVSTGALQVGGVAVGTGDALLGSTGTWTADQTFNDNVNITLGTGGDADLYYDGTNVILTPDVVGSGIFRVDGKINVGGSTVPYDSAIVQIEKASTTYAAAGGGHLDLMSNDNQAADLGARLTFGGYSDAGSTFATWADIAGRKENGSSGNTAGYLVLATRPNAGGLTERMRIDSNGRTTLFSTGTNTALNITNSNASTPYGMNIDLSAASPDNNSQWFYRGADSTTLRYAVWSDGDVANHDGTYGTISDVKFKQDIMDMRSYWDDFKSLQYRKFRHKADVEADENAPYRLGLIAQEVETVFPALVPESPDPLVPIVDVDGEPVLDADGEPTYEAQTYHKWVKSSIIEGPILGSVVQELQIRHGETSSRMIAIEARLAALEAM